MHLTDYIELKVNLKTTVQFINNPEMIPLLDHLPLSFA